MARETHTIPLEVTDMDEDQIATSVSRHIEGQRKEGRRFVAGIPISWLCRAEKVRMPGPPQPPDRIKSLKYILMVYEGER